MAKVIDITEKLSFDGNPVLKIKDKELEVKADAPTMLKVMALMSVENPSVNEILSAYELMFSEKARKEIENIGLGFKDLIVVIEAAIEAVTGGDSERE